MNLLEKFRELKRPLVLDGAIGSLLEQRGFATNDKLWSAKALINNEQEVLKIHKEYLNAGAEIITTNTFRTNPIAFENQNRLEYKEYVEKAVTLCKIATESFNDVVIAGSNPPAEDCYESTRNISQHKLEENHKRHIDELYSNDVDVIWNETFSHLDEIIFVCKYCSENKIPFVINLYLTKEFKLLSGEYYKTAVDEIANYKPIAIGLNCISLSTFKNIDKKIFQKHLHGFYLNCGKEYRTKEISCDVSLQAYKNIIIENKKNNLLFVGSCCGSNPSFTKMIKETINELYKN